MTENEFISTIYAGINVGDIIKKPKVTSEILAIMQNGNIYYRVGEHNKKYISKNELVDVYAVLSTGELSTKAIRNIVPKSKPFNSTTIQWLITHTGLAKRNQHGRFSKNWQ
ncbi:hypothetical protein [uncultured Shewanella sp.]|uniref:hypothetical protein n=1 Tax=uncultured Shewanella sp. TaxID=173975 RepID=UPI0026127BB0|nr:hypothetical protein [uncultured Shewanella sp.]